MGLNDMNSKMPIELCYDTRETHSLATFGMHIH